MGDSEESDSLRLIESQSKRKEQIKSIIEQPLVSTRAQVKLRIEELEKLLKEFKEVHEKIVLIGKPDIPYLVLGSGTKCIDLVEQTIENLRKHKVLTSPFGNSNDEDNEGKAKGNSSSSISGSSDQSIRLKKMEYKINQLMHSINSTKFELADSEENQITKEMFEFKNKIFCEQWSSISALEEEIVIHDNDQRPSYDPETCRVVLKNLNDVVQLMSTRIISNNQANLQLGLRSSKLPDLKVPIFRGDYRHWQNFKDIFDALIHNNKSVDAVRKMEYLKTYVEGEPLRLISAFTLSARNYPDAYEVLRKRYENKRQILTIHLDSMFKPIGKAATAENIKNLHDSINEGMTAIRNMDIENESWGPMVVHFAIACLDTESRSQFEQKYNDNPQDIPELSDLLKFLEGRYKTLEIMAPFSINSSSNTSSVKSNFAECSKGKEVKRNDSKSSSCLKCDEQHKVFMCPKFLALSPKSRYRLIKNVKACINCLQKHGEKKCESKRSCKHCSKRHNSLLHFEKGDSTSSTQTNNVAANLCQEKCSKNWEKMEVLATALVQIRDMYGNPFKIRVLVDTGAQGNFVTEDLVQKLRLKRIPYQMEIFGVGNTKAHQVKHAVECTLEPMFPSNFDLQVKALVMGKNLTSSTPEKEITEPLPSMWPPLHLADKSFRVPASVDMILGVSVFTKILIPETHKSIESGLMALNSQLGWLIVGEVCDHNTSNKSSGFYRAIKSMISMQQAEENLSRFWELEEVPVKNQMSKEELSCENHFKETHTRRPDGRYVVEIPFKPDLQAVTDLRTSRARAMSRFYCLESKLETNVEFALEYKRFINEYVSLGHMELIQDPSPNEDAFYLPHHAVIKSESSTTKLRVVFDASAKIKSNISLNQLMMCGPRLQDDLSTILLRWRKHKYVVTSDIEKMYRQVFIKPDHRKYLRILWRDQPTEAVRTYQLTTVTYGTAAAPYLAVKTLQQLAVDERSIHTRASEVILQDFYVDDLLTGSDTVDECLELRDGLIEILSRGGFKLRKWSSNCSTLVADLPEGDVTQELLNIEEEGLPPKIKTLGLIWQPLDDCFMFKVTPIEFSKIRVTKRALSSDISKIFDPLGFLSPVTITAKMLFQETWKMDLDWNDQLPEAIFASWRNFRASLQDLEYIKIPRWLEINQQSKLELHGFSDASQTAYAAAIYIKSTTYDGTVSTNLVMSRTKVAPIKQHLSVAKLELCGAHLLAKLYKYVVTSFQWEDKPFTAWCDSTIVLAWLKGEPSRWKIFVANRVSEIHSLTPNIKWRYVPTTDNSADCATRGLSPTQLLTCELWWNGPNWLKQSQEQWPTHSFDIITDIPEEKKRQVIFSSTKQNDGIEFIIQRFSSYRRMLRVLALCLRFATKCKRRRSKTTVEDIHLTVLELTIAEESIIRLVQLTHFHDEIQSLRTKQVIQKTSFL